MQLTLWIPCCAWLRSGEVAREKMLGAVISGQWLVVSGQQIHFDFADHWTLTTSFQFR
jgi:hypothetical protein